MTTTIDTSAPLVTPGRLIYDTANTRLTMVIKQAEGWESLPEGDLNWFVAEFEYTGRRTFCRFTGRTRRVWGRNVDPSYTIERYEVDTVVEGTEDAPVIMGRPGKRLPGVWACNPHGTVKFL